MNMAGITAVGSLTTFHSFPRLPKELRLRIWGFAYSPRTVVVHRRFIRETDTEYLFSPVPVPGVLHACSESRFEALHRGLYTAAFVDAIGGHQVARSPEAVALDLSLIGLNGTYTPPRRETPPITAQPTILRYIWVNFDLDTFKIPDYTLGCIKAEDRAQIRRAIIEVETTFFFLNFQLDYMSEMSGLEDLELVSDVSLKNWGRNLGWVQEEFEKWFNRSLKIKITEKATGDQMDSTNYIQRAAALRGRGRGRGH